MRMQPKVLNHLSCYSFVLLCLCCRLQTIVETGVSSTQVVPCQNGKKFVVPYVVYEKVWQCSAYPADEIVTFRDIKISCDNKVSKAVCVPLLFVRLWCTSSYLTLRASLPPSPVSHCVTQSVPISAFL